METLHKEHFDLISNQLQITLSAGVVCTWIVELPSYQVTGDKILFEFFGLPFTENGSVPLDYFINSMHEEDRPVVLRKIEEAITHRTHYEVEYRINEKNPRWVFASGKVDDLVNPTKFLGFIIDISQKKKSELALKESEQRFHFMTSIIPQQVWTAHPNGLLDYVNKQACDYFGKDAEQVIGEGWQKVVHPDDLQKALTVWQQALELGGIYEAEFRLLDRSGEYRWHLARAIPYKQEGNTVKWFGTNTDIQDQKLLNQKKDDFISIASHELKTPLTSLKASLQLIEKLITKPDSIALISKFIKQSTKSINKLTYLVEDLLNVTKLNEGQLHLNKEEVILAALVQDCCQHFRADNYNIITSGDLEVKVFADAHRIDQVLVNLVNNAVKYAPQSKRIDILIERANDFVKVSVSDYGPGIPKEKKERLFQRYYRANAIDSQVSGLGLGLFICKEIISKHEGDIGVESVSGAGSTFWFTLPHVVN